MLTPGLVSITFRQLEPAAICDLVSRAGLQAIEWGGDVHVPHGDLARAREVRTLTENAGLSTAAYGSYFRIIDDDGSESDFEPVLETAAALGAPSIRVWAGTRGSADANADEAHFTHVADRLHTLCDAASPAGIRIALEFHGGTLTDTTETTLQLLDRASHPNLDTLWQPPVGMPAADCEESLRRCLPRVSNIHVFHWFPTRERQPLAEGTDRWSRYIEILRTSTKEHALLLEFVQNDAPGQFLADAESLKSLL